MMRNILILLLTLGFISLAEATPSLEDQIATLKEKSFKAKITAVQNLAQSGDPRVVPILEALLVGKLYTRNGCDLHLM